MSKKDDVASDSDDLRLEYDLSQLRGRVQGKHFQRYQQGTNLALLAPDVRAAFSDDEAVNRALRSVRESHAE